MRRAVAIGVAVLLSSAAAARATPITIQASGGPCPSSTGPATSAAYTAAGGLCNVVITFNADGTVTTLITNSNPYDGAEDSLVGIVNDTTSGIPSIDLSSLTLALFGFDGDGACVTGGPFVQAGPCGGLRAPTASGADYAGPGVTFTNIAANRRSGTVNFGPLIAPLGGTAWFSLEEPPSLDIIVGPGQVPEPGTLTLLASGLIGISRWRRRKGC
jgi:PEP-CTERM motif